MKHPKKVRRWPAALIVGAATLILGVIIGTSAGGDPTTAAPESAVTVTVTAKADPAKAVTEKAAPAPTVTVTEKGKPGKTKNVMVEKTVTAEPEAPAQEAEPPEGDPADTGGESESDDGDGSMAQEQALRQAESYLETAPFSKTGLQKQLEFEGYSRADAKWAVNHVEADWNEQAVKAATNYLEMSPFSEADLVEQLKFEGYTPDQAQHGASVAYSDQ